MGGVVDELYSTDLEIAGEPGVKKLYEPASADQPAAPAAEEQAEQPSGKRKVRAVGPNVYPVR